MEKGGVFHNCTDGEMGFSKMAESVISFIENSEEARCRVIIGADSSTKKGEIDYVVAVIVHRVGEGARYWWRREVERGKIHLATRIHNEAAKALELANSLLPTLRGNGVSEMDIEVHVDIGSIGETRMLIREVTGMIRGSGFNCKIKPDAFGASSVADKHSK